jgi:hypothetical protein
MRLAHKANIRRKTDVAKYRGDQIDPYPMRQGEWHGGEEARPHASSHAKDEGVLPAPRRDRNRRGSGK